MSNLQEFLVHFNKYPLHNEDFEFPDLLGDAYEYLIKFFADSAGKKGGEFYTPAEVVCMMVQVLDPEEGMRVYDPTCGSGGALIQSKQYVEEKGQNARDLTLFGQDANGGTWSICKMNMILHDIQYAKIEHGDTLTDPRHTDGGEIMHFDRVIANSPFSIDYSRKSLTFTERYLYGFSPEGKEPHTKVRGNNGYCVVRLREEERVVEGQWELSGDLNKVDLLNIEYKAVHMQPLCRML
ncbi:MAG: SAM-dependent methyltransferase [Methanosarcinaceae archaeon]|nr:SAM-dependent methyltransferase [Methanosarcinaceae archaeon]